MILASKYICNYVKDLLGYMNICHRNDVQIMNCGKFNYTFYPKVSTSLNLSPALKKETITNVQSGKNIFENTFWFITMGSKIPSARAVTIQFHISSLASK